MQDADSVGQRGSAEAGRCFSHRGSPLARQTPPAVDLVIFHGTSSDFRTFAPSLQRKYRGVSVGTLFYFCFTSAHSVVDTLVGVTDGHFPQSLLHFLQLCRSGQQALHGVIEPIAAGCPSPASAPPRPLSLSTRAFFS